MRKRLVALIPMLAVLFLTAAVALAAKPPYTLSGKVIALTDGDALTIEDDAKPPHKIRLAGIDAPELAQAFGAKARDALAEKVSGKVVRVEVIDIDRYKQEVGRMYLARVSSTGKWSATDLPGGSCGSTCPANSSPRKPTLAHTNEDSGPTRIRCPPGNSDGRMPVAETRAKRPRGAGGARKDE